MKQVVIESVHKDGAAVLNAEDPLVAEMAAATDARVVYFALSPQNHIMEAHLADGGWGVFVDNGAIILAKGDDWVELVELDRVPFTMEGKVRFQVLNALAATAAVWAAGLNPAIIGRALTTFKADTAMVPGRFNLLELNGVELIFDYGHNAAALKALGEAVQALDKRRTVMVIGLPGDRRDEDLIATFEATIPFVDEYILHDLEDRRERDKDEIPRLMQSRLPANHPTQIVADQHEAILQAWKRVRPGDRLMIVADIVDKSLETLQNLAESVSEDAACIAPLTQEYPDLHPAFMNQSSPYNYGQGFY